MLRSSMKKSIFLPEGGPNRFLRFFSSLVSNMSLRFVGLVCAEYFMV